LYTADATVTENSVNRLGNALERAGSLQPPRFAQNLPSGLFLIASCLASPTDVYLKKNPVHTVSADFLERKADKNLPPLLLVGAKETI